MSKRIPFNRQINHALLTKELREALGTIVDGIVFDFTNEHGEVILTDAATAQDEQTAQSLVEAHDETQLTEEQQIEANAVTARDTLAGMIANRIVWHEANPVAADNAAQVLTRLQTEWLVFMKYVRRELV